MVAPLLNDAVWLYWSKIVRGLACVVHFVMARVLWKSPSGYGNRVTSFVIIFSTLVRLDSSSSHLLSTCTSWNPLYWVTNALTPLGLAPPPVTTTESSPTFWQNVTLNCFFEEFRNLPELCNVDLVHVLDWSPPAPQIQSTMICSILAGDTGFTADITNEKLLTWNNETWGNWLCEL